MANFLSPLRLEYIDGHLWRLTEPFEYHMGAPDGANYVAIPTGFVTDFASIPRALWPVLPPTGTYGKAAVVHDWLYQMRIIDHHPHEMRLCTRAEADATLNEAMIVLGVGRWTRWTIYGGVRIGGWAAWNHYRSQENHHI